MSKRILFLIGRQACLPSDALHTSRAMGFESHVISACSQCGCSDVADVYEDLNLLDIAKSLDHIATAHSHAPFSGVIGYDDEVIHLGAIVANTLGLVGNPVNAAEATRDKVFMKETLSSNGVPIADFVLASDEDHASDWAESIGFPVVVKPTRGSASQGVIRADDELQLRQAYRRVRRILQRSRLDTGGRPDSRLLVERYLSGQECSVELLLQDGNCHALGIFDKPDPLVGPFFEETIYTTPSRLIADEQNDITSLAVRAAKALGLQNGAAHCEIRLTESGPHVIEIASRLTGGACSRVVTEACGVNIHEILLKICVGMPAYVDQVSFKSASGAAMVPIPHEGRVKEVSGVDRAKKIPGIIDVIMNIEPGDVLIPFPEQSCYVGFITASASEVSKVEDCLRSAIDEIEISTDSLSNYTFMYSLTGSLPEFSGSDTRINSLEEFEVDEAVDEVRPIIAATSFPHLPKDVAANHAQECIDWLLDGNRGRTSTGLWFICPDAGVALGSYANGVGFVSCLGVMPDQKGGRIGESLVRSVMSALADVGCKKMEVCLDPRNPAPLELYRRLGFEPATTCTTCA